MVTVAQCQSLDATLNRSTEALFEELTGGRLLAAFPVKAGHRKCPMKSVPRRHSRTLCAVRICTQICWEQ